MAAERPDTDDALFVDEEEEAAVQDASSEMVLPWKILIVDDDPEVHAITRVVLGDVRYDDRPLTFLSAYSGTEARTVAEAHPDVAAILLDVVMETDDAGLKVVRYIRDELCNRQVRIILRTGQPGQAPERQVIVSYDINDYKAKSELTAQKLFTATIAALRSYQHISVIESHRRGMERIADVSAVLLEARSPERYGEGVLRQLTALLGRSCDMALLNRPGSVPPGTQAEPFEPTVLAGLGSFAALSGQPFNRWDGRAGAVGMAVDTVLAGGVHAFGRDHTVLSLDVRTATRMAAAIAGHPPLGEIERRLLAVFCDKAAVGFDNVYLYAQLANAQKATVYALGKLAEYKDEVTGDHVKRIERWSELVALELRRAGHFRDVIDDLFCAQVGMASILHDVGKVGIPDSILRKPGPLDAEEMKIMRGHAQIGGLVLQEAARVVGGRSYLSLAAEIAEHHHERFDGNGYPHRLAGNDIPLAGRIVAVADVYDALRHQRPYKQAWPRQKVLDLIQSESGRHFDPRVVEAFLAVEAVLEGLAPTEATSA